MMIELLKKFTNNAKLKRFSTSPDSLLIKMTSVSISSLVVAVIYLNLQARVPRSILGMYLFFNQLQIEFNDHLSDRSFFIIVKFTF